MGECPSPVFLLEFSRGAPLVSEYAHSLKPTHKDWLSMTNSFPKKLGKVVVSGVAVGPEIEPYWQELRQKTELLLWKRARLRLKRRLLLMPMCSLYVPQRKYLRR